jgi:hypothetical protein
LKDDQKRGVVHNLMIGKEAATPRRKLFASFNKLVKKNVAWFRMSTRLVPHALNNVVKAEHI